MTRFLSLELLIFKIIKNFCDDSKSFSVLDILERAKKSVVKENIKIEHDIPINYYNVRNIVIGIFNLGVFELEQFEKRLYGIGSTYYRPTNIITLINNIVTYLYKYPEGRTIKQIQSRFKNLGFTCKDIESLLLFDPRFDIISNAYASKNIVKISN